MTELKSFLGLLNYYGKFAPRLASMLAPLYELLRKHQPWRWTERQDGAFNRAKRALSTLRVLVHFDQSKPIVVICDASPYGVGAVLAHRMPSGEDRPIAFVSRTLTKAEKNYAQIDKEGLALIFAVKKFHNYVFGRSFTVVTDHRPLLSLFDENRSIPALASSRIQRWALTLAAYQYAIEYRPRKDSLCADALSRLPLEATDNDQMEEEKILAIDYLATTPVTAKDIRLKTGRDPWMSRVLRYTLEGWPRAVDK